VVINRSTGNDQDIITFCASAGVPILGIIPFDREIAHLHGQGEILVKKKLEWEGVFRGLYDRCIARVRDGR
jgi:MinD superfamily P-loop ATPase containing an inserted ferredoxin domain